MRFRKRDLATAADHVQALQWSGPAVVVTPVTGPILVADSKGKFTHELPDHGLGNGISAASDATIVTCGFDGSLRLYPIAEPTATPKTIKLGRGQIERAKWSPDQSHLAAALGKTLFILDPQGETIGSFANHQTSVSDFAWNPANPREIATVCGGGARMWRIGETEPYARFDWGGASLLIGWSADGRWIVTGDQTPSVHIYDFTRDNPLHIQGYEAKVKAFDFTPDSQRLATGGSSQVTVWNCTGDTGPEGTTPAQLQFHKADVEAIAWSPSGTLLATGDISGRVVISDAKGKPIAAFETQSPISAFAWSPDSLHLACGEASGKVTVFSSIP